MSIENGIVGHVQRAHSTVAKTALNEISTNGIASPKHVEEPAADLLPSGVQRLESPARLPRSRPGCHYTAKRGRSVPERPHMPVPVRFRTREPGLSNGPSDPARRCRGLDLQSAMLSRRTLLMAPLAVMAARTVSAAGKMTLAIHQNTSSAAGYRRSLEGWARAGIKNVELTNNLLDEFLKSDSLPAAKRVLTDLGLTPVSSACGVFGLWEPNPKRAAQLDAFKKRCEQFASLGLTKIYSPTPTTEKFTEEDYKRGVANMRENGDIAKQ